MRLGTLGTLALLLGAQHGHNVNMTNPGYTQVACGFVQNSWGEWWEVQDFR